MGQLVSTPLMDRYFQDTYKVLSTRPKKGFSPKFFDDQYLQAIANHNIVRTTELTNDQKIVLTDEHTLSRLTQEKNLLEAILDIYREREKDRMLELWRLNLL